MCVCVINTEYGTYLVLGLGGKEREGGGGGDFGGRGWGGEENTNRKRDTYATSRGIYTERNTQPLKEIDR